MIIFYFILIYAYLPIYYGPAKISSCFAPPADINFNIYNNERYPASMSNLKIHYYKIAVSIQSINISVKFPCSVSIAIKAGIFAYT